MQSQLNLWGRSAVLAGAWWLLSLTNTASAVDILDDPVQIDERLTQVIDSSNSLCWEMYRYHQQQPDYRDSYQAAKDFWGQAVQLRDSIRNGPAETEVVNQQIAAMNDNFRKVEASLSKWGPGDQSNIPNGVTPTTRTVVTPGVGVNIPFVNVQVGGGSTVEVVDDVQPQLQRRRLSPNAHGSKRSLERELAAVKVSLSYLTEDAGLPSQAAAPTPGELDQLPVPSTQSPQPPKPDSSLNGTVVPQRKTEAKAASK